MNGRQVLGAVLLFVGVGVALIGVLGLGGSPATGAGPTAPPASFPSLAPGSAEVTAPVSIPPSTVAPTAAPTPAPTIDTLGLVRDFFVDLQAAVREGAQERLVASLAGAVVDRYGISTCETTLASRDPSPEQAFEILSVTGPAPWDYVTDGLTTTVPDAYTLQARVTGPDPSSGDVATRDAELHVSIGEGMVFWYTDCGDPLPA